MYNTVPDTWVKIFAHSKIKPLYSPLGQHMNVLLGYLQCQPALYSLRHPDKSIRTTTHCSKGLTGFKSQNTSLHCVKLPFLKCAEAEVNSN